LQIKLLRLLRLIGQGDSESSDIMSDVLAQVQFHLQLNRSRWVPCIVIM
jgi:AP-1 complex subunit gamma-1